jgi:rod shape-determining protein MreC
MEYSPPPLFKQGASARAKMIFFAVISLVLLVVDSRMRTLSVVRQTVGTVLYPLEVVAMMPRDAAYAIGGYFVSLSELKRENEKLKTQQTLDARALQQGQQLQAENNQLRSLLGTSQQLPVKSILGEILYDTRDAFTRKIVLDRGSKHGVTLGQPVIDHAGVVGQVTRVFPFTSEVTLLTDKDQTIPVQVVRSGLRSVTYGRGQSNMLDLRFMPSSADIQKGDVLVTSGIDGVYPAGLAVAKVVQVDTKSADAFARILCEPIAGVNRNRQLLILLTESALPPRPAAEEKDKGGKSSFLKHASSRPGSAKGAESVEPVPSPDLPAEIER